MVQVHPGPSIESRPIGGFRWRQHRRHGEEGRVLPRLLKIAFIAAIVAAVVQFMKRRRGEDRRRGVAGAPAAGWRVAARASSGAGPPAGGPPPFPGSCRAGSDRRPTRLARVDGPPAGSRPRGRRGRAVELRPLFALEQLDDAIEIMIATSSGSVPAS